MTIYVDRYADWLGVPTKWQGGGHMLTSDLEELHSFALSIGLRREWFQDKTFPHYDLTSGMRFKALRAGATPLEPGVFPPDLLVRALVGHERYEERVARAIERYKANKEGRVR